MMSATSNHALMMSSDPAPAPAPAMRHRGADLGTTRWASPPPGISMKALAVILVLGDVGYILLIGVLR